MGDKRILITGASSGLGRSAAILASGFGARVCLLGRNELELSATLASMHGQGHSIIVQDVSDLDAIPSVVQAAATSLGGGLDALIHCAGVHSAVPVKNVASQQVMQLLQTNVASAVLFAKGFRAKQIPKVSPSIVLLSSVTGMVGEPGLSAYSASKGALIALTKSLAIELARDGIRVNCICPGVVQTEMTNRLRGTIGENAYAAIGKQHPLGLGEPEDVANGALFLISDAARWITGTSLVIDGGYTAQ